MEPPAGLAVEAAQWLESLVQKHKLSLIQNYEHAEVYIGMPDAAGPYGYTCSTYPNRKGKRPLPCPPDQVPGAIWSSGVIPLTPAQRTGIVSWCLAHTDVPYSSLDYVALVAHTLGVNAAWLKDYIAHLGHMICSYYTDTSYSVNGVQLFNDKRWPGYVTPLDLASLLVSLGAEPIRS